MPSRVAVDAGERDRLVTIQKLVEPESEGSSGYPVETWAKLATAYMSKAPAGGRERFTADQITAPFDTRWEGPYRADLDPELIDVPKKRRLVYNSRVYDIVHAAMIGRHQGIELMTVSGGLLT